MPAVAVQEEESEPSGMVRRLLEMESARAAAAQPETQEEEGTGGSSQETGAPTWRELLEAAETSQRLTGDQMLTDTFGRKHTYLRISLTEKCNLRCQYCMPEEGIDLTKRDELLSTEELLRLTRLFTEAGIEKIRLTGGEPTVRKDLPELARTMRAMPGVKHIGITTNGILLKKQLPRLHKAGIDLLNISLDTLQPDKFEIMTRRKGHQRVLDSIDTAIEMGYEPVKVNVVLMRGKNDDEMEAFVELTRHKPINVRFIEYMPFDGNVWSNQKMITYKEMVQRVETAFPQGLERLGDPRGEVAKNFRIRGFRGSVSFITSMTSNFCGDCNRLRMMADGNLKVCLFGASEVSLRDAMRDGATDEQLRTIISAAVDRKKAAHAGMFELARTKNRSMIKIGG